MASVLTYESGAEGAWEDGIDGGRSVVVVVVVGIEASPPSHVDVSDTPTKGTFDASGASTFIAHITFAPNATITTTIAFVVLSFP